MSWSLVDFDGVEKAAYHSVRRAFAPVLASFRAAPGGQVELWISNDRRSDLSGRVTVSLETLDGAVIESWPVDYQAPSGGHVTPWRAALATSSDQVLRAVSADAAFEAARHFLVPVKDLNLIDGRPAAQAVRLGPTKLRIGLSASVWLPFVHLSSARPDLRFSDNHFDLAPGEVRWVEVSAAAPVGFVDLGVSWWPAMGGARAPVPLLDLTGEETGSL